MVESELVDANPVALLAQEAGEPIHIVEVGLPPNHFIRLHPDGSRELVRMEDGVFHVMRPA